MKSSKIPKTIFTLLVIALIGFAIYNIYTKKETPAVTDDNITKGFSFTEPQPEPEPEIPKATHIKTPAEVRGIYVSANSFLYKPFLENLDKLIDTTTINTIVVDIKDAPGTIDYDIGFDTPCVKPLISNEDLRKKLDYYHSKNIYVIARVAVMRDACFAKAHPEYDSIKNDGTPWRDAKGNYWLTPSSLDTAQYIANIGKAVYDSGFDEIQLDYVRYPSDGQMSLLKYQFSPDVNASSTSQEKRIHTLGAFVAYVRKELGDIPLSADVFGMVLTNTDDLGIGQHIDDFVPNVDYLSAMIYPSHFNKNWNGINDTNKHPYETIYASTKMGIERISAKYGTSTAMNIMRPWLQDFSLYGVTYNAPEVKAQIKALDDLGVHSFLLWNASNRYTKGVLEK